MKPLRLGCACIVLLWLAPIGAQAPVTGDHSTPLRVLEGNGNVGVSNAVLRDQAEVRVLRVVVDAGGTRPIHAHDDVRFHLFVPISGPMALDLDGGRVVQVAPWHPYYMEAGTQHGFRNVSAEPIEIMEVFVR